MNWKDHPHLFANGKFKIKAPDGIVYRAYGIKSNGWILTYDQYQNDEWENIEYCTLIARKMGDMTGEERDEWLKDMHGTGSFITDESYSTAYILSIGIYPFDQSHFNTGEVIDIKTVEES